MYVPSSHVHKNYLLFPVMQALLRLHRLKYAVRDTGKLDSLSMQVGQILELASGGVELGGAVGVAVGGAMGGATSEGDEQVCTLSVYKCV